MRSWLIKRLLLIPFTLLGVTFLVFCITKFVPGGPVEQMLQQQAISALSGEKASSLAVSATNESDIEKLEEMFNLQEPLPIGYLQWLGLMPKKTFISKAELERDGTAAITLSGEGSVLRIKRDGDSILPVSYSDGEIADFISKGWQLRLETPLDRAERWARRKHIRDEKIIAERAADPSCNKARAVAFKREFCGLVQGELGNSYKYNEPVSDMMLQRLPVSLYFGISGAVIAYVISVPLGLLKAVYHKSRFDTITSTLIFIGYAVPGFALGAALVVFLGARMEWFPLCGLISSEYDQLSPTEKILDLAHHTVLPLFCYVISSFAVITMMMKNNAVENLSADYMRTAIAKGTGFHRAVIHHAFRNSVIPVVSGMGGIFASAVAGSVLIERVFDIQGFGLLSYQALMDKDYSLMMGILLLSSVLLMVGNLLADILVAAIDPRIQFK